MANTQKILTNVNSMRCEPRKKANRNANVSGPHYEWHPLRRGKKAYMTQGINATGNICISSLASKYPDVCLDGLHIVNPSLFRCHLYVLRLNISTTFPCLRTMETMTTETAFTRLIELIRTLRGKDGCPWGPLPNPGVRDSVSSGGGI